VLVIVIVIASAAGVASLPYWLPAIVIRLRMRIFTAINGEEGIEIPGKVVGASQLKQVYSHPAANGRSQGAALSDLFWYWLAPGPEVHQEHLEPGERYEEVARTTRRILGIPRRTAEETAAQCAIRILDGANIYNAKLVRIRDLMMPVWAEFYYALVFGEQCPAAARELIVGNADDVVTALKCCSLRHMKRRHHLTRFLIAKIRAGKVPHVLPTQLSTEEQAFYLQGTYFNTAVVQMSEAMVHLCMVIAQHDEVRDRLERNLDDDRYLDRVITEMLRLYPLFGISHRIASADIVVDKETTIPEGSVLCFNHPDYHRTGFEHPEDFEPDRWENLLAHEQNYIPFGVAANRPCPASGLAPVTMRAVVREMLRRYAFYSSASHTRSSPNRGPCLMVSKAHRLHERSRRTTLAFLRVRDRWENVWRSLVQLVLGTYMVWDARRLRLCASYFEGKPPAVDAARVTTTICTCPVTGHGGHRSSRAS
jgi:hypothetical protein